MTRKRVSVNLNDLFEKNCKRLCKNLNEGHKPAKIILLKCQIYVYTVTQVIFENKVLWEGFHELLITYQNHFWLSQYAGIHYVNKKTIQNSATSKELSTRPRDRWTGILVSLQTVQAGKFREWKPVITNLSNLMGPGIRETRLSPHLEWEVSLKSRILPSASASFSLSNLLFTWRLAIASTRSRCSSVIDSSWRFVVARFINLLTPAGIKWMRLQVEMNAIKANANSLRIMMSLHSRVFWILANGRKWVHA